MLPIANARVARSPFAAELAAARLEGFTAPERFEFLNRIERAMRSDAVRTALDRIQAAELDALRKAFGNGRNQTRDHSR